MDEIRNVGCCRILLKFCFFFFLKIDIIINVHIVPQLYNKNFNRWIVLEVVVRRLLSYNSFGEWRFSFFIFHAGARREHRSAVSVDQERSTGDEGNQKSRWWKAIRRRRKWRFSWSFACKGLSVSGTLFFVFLLLKSQSPHLFDLVSLFQKVPPPRQILLVPTSDSHASGLHLFPTFEPIQLELMVVVILHSPLHY
jgi:hypothetical protein